MCPGPRLPWWKREIGLSRLQTLTVFVLGVLSGAILLAVVAVCLREVPWRGDWRVMAAGCGLFGLAACGLVECGRQEPCLGRRVFTAKNVAAIAWLIAVAALWPSFKPKSVMDGIFVLGLTSCVMFLPLLGAIAITRDACRAILARGHARKHKGGTNP